MEVAWSRFDTHAQWALWLLTTTRHLEGEGVGGVMFDYMGPVQRQGAAVFNESIFFAAPEGDTSPDAWERRMRFFTTCHEMGHCFNLAHSWQKERIRGLQRHQSVWRGLRNEPQARSFMNYPELVNGGPTAFFRSFGFRFTNQELLFMRHAPPPYVEMGNSTWATGHGARLDVSPHQAFHLEVRANRERPEFEFLEPVVLEIKLKNMSDDEVEIEKHVLETDALTIWITKTNGRRVRFLPLARYCLTPQPQRLGRNESMYRSLFAAVGATGWHIADPGRYAVQAALRVRGESIVSKPFELIVKPPGSSAEEYAAKDFFTADVGRVLAFDGSRVLSRANEALLDMSDRLAYSRMAIHAKVALGCAEAAQSKMLRIDANDKQIVIEPARPESREKLRNTLLMQPEAALETLGHIDYKTYVEWLADRYHEAAEPAMEYECLRTLAQTMSHRQVNRRPIRQSVLDSINRRLAEFQA
jgi:hypothetical protein